MRPLLPPRYTQWLKIEFASYVPLRESEARIINLAIQRTLENASPESPLRDTAFNPARFTKAIKNV